MAVLKAILRVENLDTSGRPAQKGAVAIVDGRATTPEHVAEELPARGYRNVQ